MYVKEKLKQNFPNLKYGVLPAHINYIEKHSSLTSQNCPHGSEVGTETQYEKNHYIFPEEQICLRSTYLEF